MFLFLINNSMKNYVNRFGAHLLEKQEDPILGFAQARLAGAKTIADKAKAQGGFAMLTYHHFVVKLPYYKRAAAGKFEPALAKEELAALNRELVSLLKAFEPKDEIPFQRVMGKIEVLGELIIFASKK